MTEPLHGTRRESERVDREVSTYRKIVGSSWPWRRFVSLVVLALVLATAREVVALIVR